MKVIDLLNKIANREEVPKKIKWEDTIYAYSEYDKDYLEFPFSEEEYKGLFDMKDSILTQYLNDEVEIIEEDKEIEEIPFNNGMKEFIDVYHELEHYNYKINEIRIAVNELRKGK